jgi:GMP synthase-like glutamine amidotransferase
MAAGRWGVRVHVLRHASFEGLGSIQPWLQLREALISESCLFEQPRLPGIHDFDWLIVMGGPMSVNDEQAFPWLAAEKRLIAESISAGKVVLGICLGAQLIACALGARVYPSGQKEIGWFPVHAPTGVRSASAGEMPAVLRAIPAGSPVFHWHGDTFDLPRGASHLLQTTACENQAFSLGERVLGLQFHLEMTREGAAALVENCAADITAGPWMQPALGILAEPKRFERINAMMADVLDTLPGSG